MRQEWGTFVEKPAHSAEQIGSRLSDLLAERNLSRKDLAKAIGLKSESSISEIINGRNSKKYQQLAEIAVVLGTTPNQLLGFEAPPPPSDIQMMGAAVQKMLIDDGWLRERAEALVDIALEIAGEKSELDLDRRLAAAFRRRALTPRT